MLYVNSAGGHGWGVLCSSFSLLSPFLAGARGRYNLLMGFYKRCHVLAADIVSALNGPEQRVLVTLLSPPLFISRQSTYKKNRKKRFYSYHPHNLFARLFFEKIIVMTTMYSFLSLSCLLYTSPSPRDEAASRMPSSA